MSAPESWKAAYRDLIETIVRMGYPEELGKAVAKNLGSEKTMRRMTAYLHSARPRSAEEIVDEMLAIMSDRERWIRNGKKKRKKPTPGITNCCITGLAKVKTLRNK